MRVGRVSPNYGSTDHWVSRTGGAPLLDPEEKDLFSPSSRENDLFGRGGEESISKLEVNPDPSFVQLESKGFSLRICWSEPAVEDAFWLAFATVHAEKNPPLRPCFWERVTVEMRRCLPKHLEPQLSGVLRKRLTCTHFSNLRRNRSLEEMEERLRKAQRALALPSSGFADGCGASHLARSSKASRPDRRFRADDAESADPVPPSGASQEADSLSWER